MPEFFFDEAEFTKAKKPVRARIAPRRTGCDGCKLQTKALSPRMEPFGEGRMSVMIVGNAPVGEDDKQDKQFVSDAGEWLREIAARQGLVLDIDCVMTNAVQCRTPGDRTPDPAEVQRCRPRLERQIKAMKPDLIIALGTTAISAVLNDAPSKVTTTATVMHGRIVPSQQWGCWVACGYHPSWYVHEDGKYDGRMREVIAKALQRLADRPTIPPPLDPGAFDIIEDAVKLENVLSKLDNGDKPVAFDFEATGLDPWAPDFKVLSFAVTDDPAHAWGVPLDHPHAMWGDEMTVVWDLLRWFIQDSKCPKVIQNWQYEELVARVHLQCETGFKNVLCDTMLREHVLDNRRAVCSQEFQEYVRYGIAGHKGSVSIKNLKQEYLDDLLRYNCLDVRYGLQWKMDQDAEMDEGLSQAYSLFHEAVPVLAACTVRGINVDAKALDTFEAEISGQLIETNKTGNMKCLKQFENDYGKEWDIGNHNDRKNLFFGTLGLKPTKPTASAENDKDWQDDPLKCGSDQANLAACLSQVDEDSEAAILLRACTDQGKLDKLLGTYIRGSIRDQRKSDGCVHPLFHLHKVQTYRSSSSNPNFQNFPKRDGEQAKVRQLLIPRNDVFIEADYSQAEVRTLACRTLDKRLCRNIEEELDFHKYYAAMLYEVDEEEIDKDMRYAGKSGFVFPEFYSSRHASIARKNPQWRAARVEEVERMLWNDMPDVRGWQDATEAEYLRDGYIRLLTGFIVRFGDMGMLSRFQLSNWPMQGPAFHRLLRALIDSEKEMRRRKMKSVICGQIHDSIVTDAVADEVDEVIELQRDIMKRPVWDWCKAVPWEAEFSIGPNMIDMKEQEIA